MNEIHSLWLAAERAGQHGEVALPLATAGLAGQREADALGGRLIDEVIARVGLGVRVPRQHLDAALTRFTKHGGNARTVLDRNADHIHLARDPVLDDLVLLRGVEAGWAVPDELHAELARRLLGADAAADEVGSPLASASSR